MDDLVIDCDAGGRPWVRSLGGIYRLLNKKCVSICDDFYPILRFQFLDAGLLRDTSTGVVDSSAGAISRHSSKSSPRRLYIGASQNIYKKYLP